MSDPYLERGFGTGRIGFGKRAGVVVVDFQKGFTEGRFPLGGRPMVERAVGNTVALVTAARKAGLPVACCYTAYSSARDAPLWKIPAVVSDFRHGDVSTELDERIYDKSYDMAVCKSACVDLFQHFGRGLLHQGRRRYRDRLRLQYVRLRARIHYRRLLLRLSGDCTRAVLR